MSWLAHVQTPAFLKGKKPLHPREVKSTRKLTNVQIHIKRVIGVIKQKYNIFSNIIPIVLLKNKYDNAAFIDKTLTVCCSLYNLNSSIVPW